MKIIEDYTELVNYQENMYRNGYGYTIKETEDGTEYTFHKNNEEIKVLYKSKV
jgi:hypothetical protein